MTRPAYKVEHWTVALAEQNYRVQTPQTVTVNDRAATRQAIIDGVRHAGTEFVERSDWAAHKNRATQMEDDWNYSMIAIHHAGRSVSCGPAALQLQSIQEEHMNRKKWPDIAYHYAIDCFGNIYEGRDIRFKGSHLSRYNTGVVGIVLLENLAEPEDSSDVISDGLSFFKAIGMGRSIVLPESQKKSITDLIKVIENLFAIKKLGGHQEFPNQNLSEARSCPGSHGMKLVKELRGLTGLQKP